MKTSRFTTALCLALLGATTGSLLPQRAAAQPYLAVGDVVGDFSLHARRAFTNDVGEVVAAGEPVRLSDFAGKILFMEFFYVW